MKLLKSSFFWTSLIIIVSIGIGISLLPKSIDMDLEKIGNGNKSVVFVYDYGLAISNQQTTEINKAQTMVGDTITFLIAKTGDPKGEQFIRKYNSSAPELLFFDEEGKIIDREFAVIKAEDLIKKL